VQPHLLSSSKVSSKKLVQRREDDAAARDVSVCACTSKESKLSTIMQELVQRGEDDAAARDRELQGTTQFNGITRYKSTNTDIPLQARKRELQGTTQFTCIASTKVQMLTPARRGRRGSARARADRYTQFTCITRYKFTNTAIPLRACGFFFYSKSPPRAGSIPFTCGTKVLALLVQKYEYWQFRVVPRGSDELLNKCLY
jgi:hypothetical protein